MRFELPARLQFSRGLGFRLGMLLSVAILPIGLISLMQTLNLSREAERSSELALLGRTAAAAAGERALMLNALGTADALGPAVLETLDDPDACSEMMRSYIQRSASAVYAGFTPLSGIVTCSSADNRPHDVRTSPHYQSFLSEPRVMATASGKAPISGRSVVIMSQPLYRDSELLGYVAVSLSHDLLRSTHSSPLASDQAHIMTFNTSGQILSTDSPDTSVTEMLPAGTTLQTLLRRSETTFREVSNSGEQRVFSVVPVVPGLVYALGSWNPKQTGIGNIALSRFTGFLFPLALWAVSLAVAYFAVYRLVLRHLRELRSQMRRFAIGDRAAPPPVITAAPIEIRDMSRTFHDMARILIRDEAAMEAAVQEKTVLLKEVHHRVKNNLQLIASIINMQSRVIADSDAKRVLRSVQDRVASLATIYRNLYQAEHLDSVEADRLISDIINQMANATLAPGSGLQVTTELERLTLLPDQAVPLTLLTTEAFTNALKYAGRPADGSAPWVRVTLSRDGRGKAGQPRALLRVDNSLGGAFVDTDSTGLGSQLIEAFAMQLDGDYTIDTDDSHYSLSLRFDVAGAVDEDPEVMRRVVLTSAAREGAQH